MPPVMPRPCQNARLLSLAGSTRRARVYSVQCSAVTAATVAAPRRSRAFQSHSYGPLYYYILYHVTELKAMRGKEYHLEP